MTPVSLPLKKSFFEGLAFLTHNQFTGEHPGSGSHTGGVAACWQVLHINLDGVVSSLEALFLPEYLAPRCVEEGDGRTGIFFQVNGKLGNSFSRVRYECT